MHVDCLCTVGPLEKIVYNLVRLYFQAKKSITAGKSYLKHCFFKFVMFHSYQITEVIDK